MSLVLCGPLAGAELATWQRCLRQAMPGETLHASPELADPAEVDIALVANPAPGSLRRWPALRLIQSLWAGVDRLLADDSLPPGVPLARMVDPAMNEAMAETALWAVLSLQRDFFAYARQQREGLWHQAPQRRAADLAVSVLGLGQMGGTVARRLMAQGYRVNAWRLHDAAPTANAATDETTSETADEAAGLAVSAGAAALPGLLARSDVVINLLPLTAATRGLLDARFFAALPRGAAVVNLARGAHLVDADLLAALDSGQLRHAVLDVFAAEPLPAGHRYWSHPAVTLLPHVAAQTDPRSAAAVVAANVAALRAGRPLAHLVHRARGY
ncbi:MAG TPA: glyoxylate/hydroxypyruvate reductase A [Ideonella sp.]|nr:glyoxylate/hydroxypyruvate reductase A [Ideonella sp.]